MKNLSFLPKTRIFQLTTVKNGGLLACRGRQKKKCKEFPPFCLFGVYNQRYFQKQDKITQNDVKINVLL